MSLKISRGFALPLEVAGEAIAILAKRGAGKTNTATVLVEELVKAGVQTVILDPVGVWWGLRSSSDGEGSGLQIPILGGKHGDVPLEPTAGALIAEVAVTSGQSLVLDLSDFMTKADMGKFVTAFATKLYTLKGRADSLLHLVLEEADLFAPQKVRGHEHMQSAIEALVRRGRSRGIGLTMISQRSAVLSKDVLTQTDLLIVMRTTGPHDVRAIREWVDARGDEHGSEVIASLPSLATGEAWFWNPERDLLHRAQVRQRTTFDSSRTPKAGESRAEPTAAATIDLDSLGEQIAATVERVKADDPRELRKTIAELRRELERRPTETVTETVEIERVVEVPVFNGELDALSASATQLQNALDQVGALAFPLEAAASAVATAIEKAGVTHVPESARPAPARTPQPERAPRPPRPEPRPTPTRPQGEVREGEGEDSIGKGGRKVLEVLAQFPEGKTQKEVAFLAGYSVNASTIGVILSNLRKMGLVEQGQPIRPTREGLVRVGGPVERPTGRALLDQWLSHPKMGKGAREVLLTLIELYPNPPTQAELAEMTGYSPSASTLGVILSTLRKLGLVEKGRRQVPAEFMEAIQE